MARMLTTIRIASTIAVMMSEYEPPLKRDAVLLGLSPHRERSFEAFHQLYLLFSSDWTDRNRKNAITEA